MAIDCPVSCSYCRRHMINRFSRPGGCVLRCSDRALGITIDDSVPLAIQRAVTLLQSTNWSRHHSSRDDVRKAMTVISESPRSSGGDCSGARARRPCTKRKPSVTEQVSVNPSVMPRHAMGKNNAAGHRLQISVGRKPTCVRRDSARTVEASRVKTTAD